LRLKKDGYHMTKESVGEFLKRERELRQITLQEVAEGTKISIRRLRSIESDQFNDLPAEVFVRGFIKSYAEYIGIDPADAILRLEENLPQEELEIKKVRRLSPRQMEKSKSPLMLLVATIAAVLILSCIWFFFFQNHEFNIPGLSGIVGKSETGQNSSSVVEEPPDVQGPQILLEQESENASAGAVKAYTGKDSTKQEDNSRAY